MAIDPSIRASGAANAEMDPLAKRNLIVRFARDVKLFRDP